MYVAWDYVCPTCVCLMAFIYSYCVADKKKPSFRAYWPYLEKWKKILNKSQYTNNREYAGKEVKLNFISEEN